MSAAPVPRLCVPTGTAAACVVATEPLTEPALEARRFGAVAAASATTRLAWVQGLVRTGVCVELPGAVFVLRITAGGERHHAAVVATDGGPGPSAGALLAEPSICAASPGADCDALREALLAEARQRPVFHGTAADGTTYSGFLAADPASVLRAVDAATPQGLPRAALAAVFADPVQPVPAGLLVALGPEMA